MAKVKKAFRIMNFQDFDVCAFEGTPGMTQRQTVEAAFTSGAKITGVILRGWDLRGANLPGAIFRASDLRGANFNGANLAGACFVGAGMENATFCGANLAGADLGGSGIDGANFAGANLNGAGFFKAYARKANFTGASMNGAQELEGAKLVGFDAPGKSYYPNAAILSGSIFTGASMNGVSFDELPEDHEDRYNGYELKWMEK